MIPQEIKDKIEAEAMSRYGDKTTFSHAQFACFTAGAEFGYSLALPTIEAQAERIKQLEDFARDIANNWDCDEDSHRYNTLCRKCEAVKILHPSKTK